MLGVVSGAGERLGKQLWDGVVALVRGPFRGKTTTDGDATAAELVPAGDVQLTAFQQAPTDRKKAVALAEALLAGSGADAEFRQELESRWRQAEPHPREHWEHHEQGERRHPERVGVDGPGLRQHHSPRGPYGPASPAILRARRAHG